MASTSWPDPAASEAVNDVQYEQMIATYVYDGLRGTPADTTVAYADLSGMVIKVRANKQGIVRGRVWSSGATDFTKTVTANSSGQPRLDMLVLRMDRATWKVTEVLKAGTPAALPSLPAITRDLDTAGAGTGVWEFPVAKVTVVSGATNMAGGDVVPLGWYLSRAGVVCTSTTRPPPDAGLSIYETDTGRQYVGMGGAFGLGSEDTGYADCSTAAGWTNIIAKVRRVNGVVQMTAAWERAGGAVGTGGIVQLGSVPAGYAPSIRWRMVGYLGNGYGCTGYVDPNGGIYLEQRTVTVSTGVGIYFTGTSWPVG